MGGKHWVHMNIKMGTIDTEDHKEEREGARGEGLKNYLLDITTHHLGDRIICTPNCSITQHTHVTNLHMYS